jgi:hypothetical protein
LVKTKPSQSGYDAEIIALDILKKKGFEIVFSPEKLKRDREDSGLNDGKTLISEQHSLERAHYLQKIINPEIELGKRKIFGRYSYHEIIYEKRPYTPEWLQKIPKPSPKKVEILKKKFWERENKHRELCEFEKKNTKLMLKILGKSIVPKTTKKSIKDRVDRESDPAWKLFWKNHDTDNTFVDIFCKKNGKYFVIDVKFKNDQSLYEKNKFDITDFEALNYPKIIKNKKVGLIILIIVQDGKKFRYALTEWSDFIISPKYNPHERRKTKVKMKNLIPFEKLLKSSNMV